MEHHPLYQKVREKVKRHLRSERDREVRVRAELILLGLRINDRAEACRRLGFGRTVFYKWFRRLKEADFNINALRTKSSRPKRSPRKIGGFLETRILFYRRKGKCPPKTS